MLCSETQGSGSKEPMVSVPEDSSHLTLGAGTIFSPLEYSPLLSSRPGSGLKRKRDIGECNKGHFSSLVHLVLFDKLL